MKTVHLLIFDDAPVFGGHEMTLCDGLSAIAKNPEFKISVVFSRNNSRFIEKLSEIEGNIDLVSTDFETKNGDSFRALFK